MEGENHLLAAFQLVTVIPHIHLFDLKCWLSVQFRCEFEFYMTKTRKYQNQIMVICHMKENNINSPRHLKFVWMHNILLDYIKEKDDEETNNIDIALIYDDAWILIYFK